MAKINPLRRYARIINKLSGRQTYLPFEELQRAVQGLMEEDRAYSQRTLQRDFVVIEEMFGIEIAHRRGKGYYIKERSLMSEDFAKVLSDFELVSTLREDPEMQEYILKEHRQMHYTVDLGDLLAAIRDRRVVRFDYYRPRERVNAHYEVKPHWLKESQQRWYLVGYTDKGLRLFELGRISNCSLSEKTFVREDSVDVPALFSESFGIWNDPKTPVEEIILHYDKLDGEFLKTLPLHHTQELVKEDESGITLRLRLRITNDFRMELLSRSRSVEVLRPEHLRKEICDICRRASERNQ